MSYLLPPPTSPLPALLVSPNVQPTFMTIITIPFLSSFRYAFGVNPTIHHSLLQLTKRTRYFLFTRLSYSLTASNHRFIDSCIHSSKFNSIHPPRPICIELSLHLSLASIFFFSEYNTP